MAKGDDAKVKKKNKAMRKKLRSDPSAVSGKIAAIIAAKKRRLSGKRRMCQGMCFSLPTPDNPFNEKEVELNLKRKEKKKGRKKDKASKADDKIKKGDAAVQSKRTRDTDTAKMNSQERKRVRFADEQTVKNGLVEREDTMKIDKKGIHPTKKHGIVHDKQLDALDNQGCPSKSLSLCLDTVQNALQVDGIFSEEDRPLFVNTWGTEFWKLYSLGKNILETSGSCCTPEQVAWMVSTAVDVIARKEKEGAVFTSPFLLFLVPSREKASEVRSVCKPLKRFGIHTVSLHSGTTLDHQIHGLKSCDPEFVVSTPERLLELLSLKAIDISGVSSLVVDGPESSDDVAYLENVKSIRLQISGDLHTTVFSGCLSNEFVPSFQSLLPQPMCRLPLNDSIASQALCVKQLIHVCNSDEEKLAKGMQVLDESCSKIGLCPSKVMFVVEEDSDVEELISAIKSNGYSISTNAICTRSELESSKSGPISVMDVEHVVTTDISEFEVVIIPDFVLSIDEYKQILTSMARFTLTGQLHCLLTREDETLAASLAETFEECGQSVPEALKHLCDSSASLSEQ